MSTTYTTNYHLGKQEDTSDNFDMSVITDNMDTIDSVLKTNENNISFAIQALQAQLGNTTIKIISKEEYDSIEHDANTVYYVKDGDKVVQYLGDAKFGTGSTSGSSSLYGVANKSVNGNAEFSEIS